MKKISLIDPINDKRWDNFVNTHPDSTIFHHSAWARVLIDRYGCDPTYYGVENEKGELVAAVPFFSVPSAFGRNRLVCLPSAEHCFPLAFDSADTESMMSAAMEQVQVKKLAYLEIRGWSGPPSYQKQGLIENSFYITHTAALPSDSTLFRSRLHKDTRYHISRGERSGVVIRDAQDESDLKKYHELTTLMRKRINKLPWPYRFFQSIYRNIILTGYGYLLLAEYNGQIISGGIFFRYKDRVMNKINASDGRYMQLRPNYVLMWAALKRACQESCNTFHFGITDPDNLGLRQFKRHWLAEENQAPYYYYPAVRGLEAQRNTNPIYRTYTFMNKMLPQFVLNIAAEALYRRLG